MGQRLSAAPSCQVLPWRSRISSAIMVPPGVTPTNAPRSVRHCQLRTRPRGKSMTWPLNRMPLPDASAVPDADCRAGAGCPRSAKNQRIGTPSNRDDAIKWNAPIRLRLAHHSLTVCVGTPISFATRSAQKPLARIAAARRRPTLLSTDVVLPTTELHRGLDNAHSNIYSSIVFVNY
jgi:hypothetical protein